MANPILRVLIVDDSSIVRKLLGAALDAHPEIQVVGSAANGIIALTKVSQLEPDAIILDVEMPEMDGISMLHKLRATHPRLPVIMFSTLTERGATVTFDALAAGASDYVLKPSTQNGETLEHVVNNALMPKLLAFARSRAAASVAALERNVRAARASTPSSLLINGSASPTMSFDSPSQLTAMLGAKRGALASPAVPRIAPSKDAQAAASVTARSSTPATARRASIIAIAASTGGPNALSDVLPRIPRSLPVPVVIVQHMPPIFTRTLAERLAARCELKVLESAGGELLQAGSVYIAPGNRHLEVVREGDEVRTVLTDGPPENSCRPAADVLFRSVARVYGAAVLGVVLTGMGQDGARGAREIYQAGGRLLVQSGPTCVVWGMPRVVQEAGIAEAVVPLPEMAAALLQRVGLGLSPLRQPDSRP